MVGQARPKPDICGHGGVRLDRVASCRGCPTSTNGRIQKFALGTCRSPFGQIATCNATEPRRYAERRGWVDSGCRHCRPRYRRFGWKAGIQCPVTSTGGAHSLRTDGELLTRQGEKALRFSALPANRQARAGLRPEGGGGLRCVATSIVRGNTARRSQCCVTTSIVRGTTAMLTRRSLLAATTAGSVAPVAA